MKDVSAYIGNLVTIDTIRKFPIIYLPVKIQFLKIYIELVLDLIILILMIILLLLYINVGAILLFLLAAFSFTHDLISKVHLTFKHICMNV